MTRCRTPPRRNRRTGPRPAIPRHVAIIMDGNGRWAAARGLPRAEGHRRGVEALRRVVRAAHELGIVYLTIFSFSLGELVAAGDRDRRSVRPAAPLHPQRSRDAASRRRAGARHRRARRARARHLRAAERGRGADARQHAPHAGRRLQLRLAPGDRAAPRSGWRARSRRASAIRRRSTPMRSASISTRPTFPIPI